MKKNKIRTEKRPQLAAPLVWLVLLALTLGACGTGDGGNLPHHDTTAPRPAQTDSPPETTGSPSKIIITPSDDTTPGFYPDQTFRVLEKTGGSDSLASAAMSDVITAVKKLTGAVIVAQSSLSPADDIEKALLSGKNEYDALNLPLDELSFLWRAGLLDDLAALGLSPATRGLDRLPAEELAVSGKYYIAFGDLSPSSINSVYVLRCNLGAALSNEIHAIFGKDIRRAALDGELTLEKILSALADSELIISSTSTDAVICLPADDTSSAAHALITAAGGSIFNLGKGDETIVLGGAKFAAAYENAQRIISQSETDGSAVFTLARFSKAGEGECCLPLPKPDTSSDYRCLASPGGSNGFAVPRGTESGKRLTDIATAIAEASVSAADSYFRSMTADDSAFELARLIFASRVYSISDLYDWGDLLRSVTDGAIRGTPLAALLGDADYEKKSAAAMTAIKIFTDRLG